MLLRSAVGGCLARTRLVPLTFLPLDRLPDTELVRHVPELRRDLTRRKLDDAHGGYASRAVDAPRYCYRHPDRETGLSCSECGRPICYECMTPAPVGLRCPEHSGKPQGIRRVTSVATGVGSRRVNLVTMVLIGINLAVYGAELAAGGTVNGLGNWIYEHGVL